MNNELSTDARPGPHAVVDFWHEAGAHEWFGKRRAFDAELRRRFLHLHEDASAGRLESWGHEATGALALMILLDQFPRNAFRGTPRMYATDALARYFADRAVRAGFDVQVDESLQIFFYLPFAHSEQLDDQDRSVALHERFGYASNARRHRDIIRRFGRFPHRNPILGRTMTSEEQAFLDAGGFAG
ncbi:MAG: hypothetical protein BGO98_02880 [Myxococcales bacterium 68-20]|nr:DUF924 family protein [Myxococcales bacterium]OJY21779.1 MAG: hypothetical protein BGO98_02880 [Myxococcales bacterium 68-20]